MNAIVKFRRTRNTSGPPGISRSTTTVDAGRTGTSADMTGHLSTGALLPLHHGGPLGQQPEDRGAAARPGVGAAFTSAQMGLHAGSLRHPESRNARRRLPAA